MNTKSPLLLFLIFTIAFKFSVAQKISSFAGRSKEELFSLSINTPALEEKEKLRKYLSDNFLILWKANLRKSWLLNMEGFNTKAKELYLQVINNYPNAKLAIGNLVVGEYYSNENFEQGVGYFEKQLSNDPSYRILVNSKFIFLIKDNGRNLKMAEDKLS